MAHEERRLPTICLFLVVVICLSTGYAQQAPYKLPLPQENSASQPVFKSSTVLKYTSRLILVDIVATDRKGDPVRDLKAEDFTLTEDGEKQQVRIFEFQTPADSRSPSNSSASGTNSALPKLAANVFTNAPRYNSTRALNVVLLDALNTTGSNQAYARDQMIRFLEKLPVDQPVAVYTLGTRLRLVQDFTSDPAVLKKVIASLKGQGSPVLDQSAGGHPLDYYPAGNGLENMSMQMLAQIKQFQQENVVMQDDFRLRYSLAAMNSLARTLAGYPGRKNLIWLSESFPLSILPNTSYPQTGDAGVNSMPTHGLDSRDYVAEVIRTTSILTDAQVAVYPVDVRALVGNEFYSSLSNTSQTTGDYLGRVATARSTTAGSAIEAREQINDEMNVTSNTLQANHSTMNELADRTGGKAYYNHNDVDSAIRRTIDDGSTYYTLGYYPANKDWNGKFRKINVKVQRSGIKLHYRLGYFAIDPQAYSRLDANQRAAEFGQALSLEFPASTALIFQARVFQPSAETNSKLRVSFAVDPHQISFEQVDGVQHAGIDCAIAAYSTRGEPIRAEGGTSNAALKPEQFSAIMNSFFPCQRQLALSPGEYILRLGVRDNRTGLIGTVNAAVTVSAPPAPTVESK